MIRPVIKAHVLLCWPGGKFLCRAREIGSERGARRLLLGLSCVRPGTEGSPRITPSIPANHAPPCSGKAGGDESPRAGAGPAPPGEAEAPARDTEADGAPGLRAGWSEAGTEAVPSRGKQEHSRRVSRVPQSSNSRGERWDQRNTPEQGTGGENPPALPTCVRAGASLNLLKSL